MMNKKNKKKSIYSIISGKYNVVEAFIYSKLLFEINYEVGLELF